jgi:hypothetical protein
MGVAQAPIVRRNFEGRVNLIRYPACVRGYSGPDQDNPINNQGVSVTCARFRHANSCKTLPAFRQAAREFAADGVRPR